MLFAMTMVTSISYTFHMYSLWIVLFCSVKLSLCCEWTNVINLSVYDDVTITDEIIASFTDVQTVQHCAGYCGLFPNCASFFHNEQSQTCQIHRVVFIDPTGPTSTGSKYYVLEIDCYIGGAVSESNKLFLSDGTSQASGRYVKTSCHAFESVVEPLTCSVGETTVNRNTCKRTVPANCVDVQTHIPGSGDGEYWLYPPVYEGAKAKIYCHGMAGTPKEYLTFVTPNSGYFPAWDNQACTGGTGKWYDKAGDTTFTKVGLEIQTMEVMRTDHQFATSNRNLKEYGEAQDCYTNHGSTKKPCGPVGTFHINMVGTGVITDPEIQFLKSGWMPWAIVTKSNEDLIIDLNCGGYCGKCPPDRPFLLKLYPSQEPDLSSAIFLPMT